MFCFVSVCGRVIAAVGNIILWDCGSVIFFSKNNSIMFCNNFGFYELLIFLANKKNISVLWLPPFLAISVLLWIKSMRVRGAANGAWIFCCYNDDHSTHIIGVCFSLTHSHSLVWLFRILLSRRASRVVIIYCISGRALQFQWTRKLKCKYTHILLI